MELAKKSRARGSFRSSMVVGSLGILPAYLQKDLPLSFFFREKKILHAMDF